MPFCASCGGTLTSDSGFCGKCGQLIVANPQATAAIQAPRVAEKTFFESDGVLVTNTRLVKKDGETFAMSGVTSVASYAEVPSKKWPIILMVLGILVLLSSIRSSIAGVLIGVALTALAIWWFRSIKNIYKVRLVTASGQRDAIADTNREYISKIVDAVSGAIVYRG